MKIAVTKRRTGELVYVGEHDSLAAALAAHVKASADLREADLREANLREANLRGANLREADLREADLREANLREANLLGANLLGADLREADLREANLREANLRGANLREADLLGANLLGANLLGANLCGASLREANLREADLREANLLDIKADLLSMLDSAPAEVHVFTSALIGGRVDGAKYTGECTCLQGWIAKGRGVPSESLTGNLAPRTERPAEKFVFAIREGDTPETNAVAAVVLGWIDEWLAARAVVADAPPVAE